MVAVTRAIFWSSLVFLVSFPVNSTLNNPLFQKSFPCLMLSDFNQAERVIEVTFSGTSAIWSIPVQSKVVEFNANAAFPSLKIDVEMDAFPRQEAISFSKPVG